MVQKSIKKILVPVDFSELTPSLVDYAKNFAQIFSAELILLYVVQSFQLAEALNWLDGVIPPSAEPNLIGQLKEVAERRMKELQSQLEQKGITAMTKVLTGIPFMEIIQLAEDEGVDLIIIAGYGGGGFRKLLLGNVADKVVRKSKIPVLVYKPEEKKE